jgi:tRNA(adenine34) deaminase
MAAKSPSKKRGHAKTGKKWSHKVKTVSTFPPEGVFTKDAKTIARSLGSKKVSPKGIGSGIRMIQFFINRAGKDLPGERREELEKAKHILQDRKQRESSRGKPKKPQGAKGRKK